MRQLNVFFNWCINCDLIIINPMTKIKKFKIPKGKMKYWTTSEVKKFFEYMSSQASFTAHRTEMLVKKAFSLRGRIGETRVLILGNVDTKNNKIYIGHSVNYNPKSDDYLSSTKNFH